LFRQFVDGGAEAVALEALETVEGAVVGAAEVGFDFVDAVEGIAGGGEGLG
jgi:hypothetical protein